MARTERRERGMQQSGARNNLLRPAAEVSSDCPLPGFIRPALLPNKECASRTGCNLLLGTAETEMEATSCFALTRRDFPQSYRDVALGCDNQRRNAPRVVEFTGNMSSAAHISTRGLRYFAVFDGKRRQGGRRRGGNAGGLRGKSDREENARALLK